MPVQVNTKLHCSYLYLCQGDHVFTLFASFEAGLRKTIFRKFDGKVAHWPRKNQLEFGGNVEHVTLALELGQNCVTLRWGSSRTLQHWVPCVACFV